MRPAFGYYSQCGPLSDVTLNAARFRMLLSMRPSEQLEFETTVLRKGFLGGKNKSKRVSPCIKKFLTKFKNQTKILIIYVEINHRPTRDVNNLKLSDHF